DRPVQPRDRVAQTARVAAMPPSRSQVSQVTAPATPSGVAIEVRQGTGPSASYVVPPAGFLVGSVPGCDLRLPGKDLPALLCVIAGDPPLFRKLAPTQAILINGKTAANGPLQDGDRITLGPVDLFVRVTGSHPRTTAANEELTERVQAEAYELREKV